MSKYVFPFEEVKKGSNLIVYGTGEVGSDLLKTLRLTEYCNVVAVLDRDRAGDEICGYRVSAPEEIAGIAPEGYDTVLVAVNTPKNQKSIKEFLAERGVSADKTLLFDGAQVVRDKTECVTLPDDGGDVFRIAIIHDGGIGDVLIVLPLLYGLRRAVSRGLVIDYYAKHAHEMRRRIPYIDGVYRKAAYSKENNNYDAVLNGHWIPHPEKLCLEKAKRFSLVLYEYLTDLLWQYENLFRQNTAYNALSILQYSSIFKKKRVEINNLHDILPFDRDTPVYVELAIGTHGILYENGLSEARYITICNTVNEETPKSPKLWPVEYFNALMRMLKEKYPNYALVHIGDKGARGEIENIDLELCGQTTLDEACVLLKHGALHIGCEGGLAHLNHGLNGVSVCLYGMTHPKIYGYDENINLRSAEPEACRSGCVGIGKKWGVGGCLMDYNAQYASCMTSLEPEYVFDHIAEYLDKLPHLEFTRYETIAPEGIGAIIENGFDAALIYRDGDEYLLPLAEKLNSLIVIDRDLSEEPIMPEAPINMGYWQRLQALGIDAEYGTLHNIPASDGKFDLTVNFTMPREEYPEFALKELARVTKHGGTAAAMTGTGELALYRVTRNFR